MRMGQIKNVTFEKSRQRYVFQVRVPSDLKAEFGNRSLIRVALGRIAQSEASALASDLRATWEQHFETARRRAGPLPVPHRSLTVSLPLDSDMAARAVATWRLIEFAHLRETLVALRQSDELVWSNALLDAEKALPAARRRLLRGDTEAAVRAIAEIESRYSVSLQHSASQFADFTERLNADGVQWALAWVEVLRGERRLDTLKPSDEALLPLVRFFGTPVSALIPAWLRRLALIGKAVRPKTQAKYEAIAADLGSVLGEVPVERIDSGHIAGLGKLWRARLNGSSTVADKFTTLISLIRPMAQGAAELIRSQIPRTHLGRVKRIPFTKMQLAELRLAVEGSGYCTADDLILLDLMMLTGARLGELLQLHPADVRPDSRGWVLEIGGHRDAAVKTDTSRRTLPVDTGHSPRLAQWLAERREAKGLVFADAKADKFGHYGNQESKRLNAIIRKLYPDSRLVLESVRNTVARTLRAEQVDPRVRRGLLGHANIDIHERHYDPEGLLTTEDFLPAAVVLADLARQVMSIASAWRAGDRKETRP